jgi:hypothetical protein
MFARGKVGYFHCAQISRNNVQGFEKKFCKDKKQRVSAAPRQASQQVSGALAGF